MKVAICDNQTEVLEDLQQKVKQISYVKEVHVFSDISIFFSVLCENAYYDVVLMDIDWRDQKTGIDFAGEIEKYSPFTKIIYITAYTMEYVEDIFLKASNLSGFLMKPVKMEQLEKNLRKVRCQQENTAEKLIITSKGSVIVIPQYNIIYLENQLHKVKIVLADREYWCGESLEGLKHRLSKYFLSCHKSYMINMEQVLEFRSNEVQMTYGKTVPVSKARYREAKKCFFEYMAERI